MKKLLLAALLCLLAIPANASQNALASGTFPTISPYPGLTLVQNINSAMQAINSCNSGASPPSYQVEGTCYDDSTNNLMELYSGSAWVKWGSYTGSQFVPLSNGVPLGTCPTTTGSANAYVLTYSPAPTAYVSGQPYCFFTNFSNTGSATVNVNSLGALTLKKIGGTNLASADLGSGVEVVCIYDGTNCEIISQIASAGGGGSVTSVSADGTILSGTITTSGSFTRANAGAWSILNNGTSGSATPSYTSTPSAQAYYLGTTQATSAGKTGLHSPATNAVALEANGNDALYVTASSKVGINNTTPADYLDVGGAIGITSTSAAPVNGLSSPTANALLLSTSGSGAVAIGNDGGVTIGSPTGGDKGPGTLNLPTLYVNGSVLSTGFTSCTQVTGAGSSTDTATCAGGYTLSGCGCNPNGNTCIGAWDSGSNVCTAKSGGGSVNAVATCCH